MSVIQEAFGPDNLLKYAGEEDPAAGAVVAERTDHQLVELTLAGDAVAFEQIFERYKRLATRAASRYLLRKEEIEEVVQTVFAKVYFELGSFRGEHALSLAGWISRITANQCLDELRSRARKPESLNCELSDGEAAYISSFSDRSIPDSEMQLASRDLVIKLLQRLGPEERAILTMQYIEEMGMAEIADALGWSVSKVKIRAWRARNTLRRIIKKYV